LLAAAGDGEEQVAVPSPQGLIDEAAGAESEGAPVDPGRELRAQEVPELACGVLGVLEDGLDQGVVRVRGVHAPTLPQAEAAGQVHGTSPLPRFPPARIPRLWCSPRAQRGPTESTGIASLSFRF